MALSEAIDNKFINKEKEDDKQLVKEILNKFNNEGVITKDNAFKVADACYDLILNEFQIENAGDIMVKCIKANPTTINIFKDLLSIIDNNTDDKTTLESLANGVKELESLRGNQEFLTKLKDAQKTELDNLITIIDDKYNPKESQLDEEDSMNANSSIGNSGRLENHRIFENSQIPINDSDRILVETAEQEIETAPVEEKEEGNISYYKFKVNDFVETTINYDNGKLHTSWAQFDAIDSPINFFIFFSQLSKLNVENIDKEKYKESIKNSLNLVIQEEYIKELPISYALILNMFICNLNSLVEEKFIDPSQDEKLLKGILKQFSEVEILYKSSTCIYSLVHFLNNKKISNSQNKELLTKILRKIDESDLDKSDYEEILSNIKSQLNIA